MSILMIATAIAAAPAPTAAQQAPSAAPAAHAQHSQPDAKAQAKGGCCCEKMAKDSKMDCCAKHGKGGSADHSGHNADR